MCVPIPILKRRGPRMAFSSSQLSEEILQVAYAVGKDSTVVADRDAPSTGDV